MRHAQQIPWSLSDAAMRVPLNSVRVDRLVNGALVSSGHVASGYVHSGASGQLGSGTHLGATSALAGARVGSEAADFF